MIVYRGNDATEIQQQVQERVFDYREDPETLFSVSSRASGVHLHVLGPDGIEIRLTDEQARDLFRQVLTLYSGKTGAFLRAARLSEAAE